MFGENSKLHTPVLLTQIMVSTKQAFSSLLFMHLQDVDTQKYIVD